MRRIRMIGSKPFHYAVLSIYTMYCCLTSTTVLILNGMYMVKLLAWSARRVKYMVTRMSGER